MLTLKDIQSMADDTIREIKKANELRLRRERAAAAALLGGDYMRTSKWVASGTGIEDELTGQAPKNLWGQINVMQAFNCGEKVMGRAKKCDTADWFNTTSPIWNWAEFDYCIAPSVPKPKKPEYRPYKHSELVQLVGRKIRQAVGDGVGLIVAVEDCVDGFCVQVGMKWITPKDLLDHFVNMDGTPLGSLVEDDL